MTFVDFHMLALRDSNSSQRVFRSPKTVETFIALKIRYVDDIVK